jgi:hypothetical protein
MFDVLDYQALIIRNIIVVFNVTSMELLFQGRALITLFKH